jgi:hypothetical protein
MSRVVVLSIEAFAAKRRTDQDSLEKELFPYVSQAVEAYPVDGWYNDLLAEVARQYLSTFHNEGGTGQPKPTAADFTAEVRTALDKTKDPTSATVDRVSTWLATAILNAGTQAAADTDPEFLLMEWVTMHDSDVRPAHRRTEGQQRPIGEPFDVDGTAMRYPGDMRVPIDLWINCRCSLAPVLASEAAANRGNQLTDSGGEAMSTDTDTQPETATKPEGPIQMEPLAWHGVLAPEGVWSGDKRRFAEGALQFRDLPIPLTWQKSTNSGHDGSVVVGKVDAIERIDNMMQGTGTFLQTPEADEVVGLLTEFGKFGVSIDADNTEMEFDGEEDNGDRVTFTSARIASASLVTIPAFAEAFIALGGWAAPSMDMPDVCNQDSPDYDAAECAKQQGDQPPNKQPGDQPMYAVGEFVSDKPWSDFTQADYTPEQWKRACILHRADPAEPKSNHGLPIKEPGGALNRNAVHAAASRFNQVSAPAEAKAKAKSALRGAYKQIGEEPPDALKAVGEVSTFDAEFRRGPGWVTNPEATRRIHAYWTQKGQPGYAKIGWGVPGDFNRCRIEVGEEIGENSPEDLRFLNQICAQWHHDALGWWPGRPTSGEVEPFTHTDGKAVTLVASAGKTAPAAWFRNPHLDGPTPFSVTADGQVYGHLALWGTCHTGFDGVCIEPPPSATDYAYYLTGEVLTDEGPVPVGQVTIGGGHAKTSLPMRPALAHYDSTSSVVADVTCGEDDSGIWLAGWVRPGVSEDQVTALRASALSGDWRRVNGSNLELIAALAVNTPGFPVPRVGVHSGAQVSLVAAGAVHLTPTPSYDVTAIARAVALELRQMDTRRERMQALRARVGGETNEREPV